jgi:hypothetical protein
MVDAIDKVMERHQLTIAELQRLKRRLVQMAERDLEIEMMKEIAAKNVWSAPSVQVSRG